MLVERLSATEAYRRMRRIRVFEERCLDLSAEGVIAGSLHPCLGQEAVPVGAVAALRGGDRVLATYRGHGWAIACGVPLDGLLGEIAHRAGGVNGGRGGSAYLMAPEYDFLGENSIVGAGAPIGAGVAMASKLRNEGRVVVVSLGDGAMNQGSVHEAMNFAAMRNLPMIFVCENNGWSEMTPISTTTRGEDLRRRSDAYGIPGHIVDGCDSDAVQQAVAEAAEEARNGRGPIFLECKTVRLSGHYNRDIQHYRPKADVEDARTREPLARMRRVLVDHKRELDVIDAEVTREIDAAVAGVRAMALPDPTTAADHVFSAQTPVKADKGAGRGEATKLTYQRAVNLALRKELEGRPEVIVYGEDVGKAGGIFGATRDLQKEFGIERVFDTPISESAILGSAVGASMEGLRPVVEIMWGDFVLVALDQIVNQAANVRYISQSRLNAPMVVRMQQGVTPGSCAQHSQSLEALIAHIPGVKVGLSASPEDAYAMLRAAIADPDPCVVIEARELYQMSGEVYPDAPVEAVGGARWHQRGHHLSIITWGAMVHRALAAAERLREEGIDASVLDLRWLRPLDDDAIAEAVAESGGRILVVHEANLTAGFGSEIAARIQERHFKELKAPIIRLGSPDVRIPSAPSLQAKLVPGAETIYEAARRLHALFKPARVPA